MGEVADTRASWRARGVARGPTFAGRYRDYSGCRRPPTRPRTTQSSHGSAQAFHRPGPNGPIWMSGLSWSFQEVRGGVEPAPVEDCCVSGGVPHHRVPHWPSYGGTWGPMPPFLPVNVRETAGIVDHLAPVRADARDPAGAVDAEFAGITTIPLRSTGRIPSRRHCACSYVFCIAGPFGALEGVEVWRAPAAVTRRRSATSGGRGLSGAR